MILVIGGAYSGKTAYVTEVLGYRQEDIAYGALPDGVPVIAGVERLVAENPGRGDWLFEQLKGREAIVCQEVGCGVVPMEAAARQMREEIGRLCIRLAAEAQTVVRLTCGIPEIIKGDAIP